MRAGKNNLQAIHHHYVCTRLRHFKKGHVQQSRGGVRQFPIHLQGMHGVVSFAIGSHNDNLFVLHAGSKEQDRNLPCSHHPSAHQQDLLQE